MIRDMHESMSQDDRWTVRPVFGIAAVIVVAAGWLLFIFTSA
jgi:hypothetical protein